MMTPEEQKEILQKLMEAGVSTIDKYIPFPDVYPVQISSVKAIYLGCDPTNKKFNNRFNYAFALPTGKEYHFEAFVKSHLGTLKQLRLDLESVYAQNLCQNYFTEETNKNLMDWDKAANIWIPILRNELEVFGCNIPVLLTSELLYKILLKPEVIPINAEDFYGCDESAPIPIPSEANELSRPLIPCYRHWKYRHSKWEEYTAVVRQYLTT